MRAKDNSNELQLTRIYEASVKAVWDAWTDPEQAAKWWGPRGFTITTHSKDFRVGGIWHYTMHGPDGTDYPNKTKYFEIEKYKKLVYDHGGNDEQAPLFRVKVLFSELKGKTTMNMTMTFASPAKAREMAGFIKQASGNSTWDRLAEYLAEENGGEKKFVINRSFEAPIETMFRMWTDPNHFSNWLAPTGFEMAKHSGEIKEGETLFYSMSGHGFTMYGLIHYLKIEAPHCLVYTQQFADKDRNISRHPGAPLWPETILTKIEFSSEGPDQTRVTITWAPHGKASEAEIAAFVKERGGMTQGWTGSLDKLENYLESKN